MKMKIAGTILTLGVMLAGLLLVPVAASAQDADLGQGSQSRRIGATPPPPDVLWAQVNTCIQLAIMNDFKVLPLPGPQPVPPIPPLYPCFYVQKPTPGDAQMGDGYAIIKAEDPTYHIYHYLTLPTKAVAGIEDPQINFFSMGNVNMSYSPNYWVDAWPWLNHTIGASYTTKHPGKVLTPDQMGLAINSVAGRGLNQLHIHMACFDANVQAALATAAAKTPITTTWSAPIVLKNGHGYRAILLTNLAISNPFLVMQSVKGYNPKDPGLVTLVLTGKPKVTNQWYLLEDYTHDKDKGHGEELLDEDCTTVK